MNADDQKTTMPGPPGGAAARLGTDEAAAPSRSSMAKDERSLPRTPKVARGPALVVALIVAATVGLSLWYLVQPQPLIIQGEADATRIDIAARVDGRVGERPVERGDNVAAGQLLYKIDNPELVTKLKEAEAGLAVASAQLANTLVGTRVEVLAQRKAAVESASANLTLAQQTYDRVKELARTGNAPLQKLDEATDNLKVAQRTMDQANFANEEAINGATKEERGIARANVDKAQASIDTIKAQVDELVVKAPVTSQVYQIGAELGEYVSPGVPLLSLIDLSDVWLRFDLREDLVKGLKPGDQFQMRVPALRNQLITAAIRVVETKGEYAGWRSTRATGDFDLRTFQVRAYPITPIPELRPGMSVYAEWPRDRR